MAKIVGVDYGAKLSGNTVIAYYLESKVYFHQTPKKTDADAWLKDELDALDVDVVYLDAPLSLPAAYFGKGDSYHYRQADKLTKAMSPMFLGGLTARAMALKATLNQYRFYEIYPAFFQSQIIQSAHYKKDIRLFLSDLREKEPYELGQNPTNWHQVDALMALLIGTRHIQNRHQELGNPKEGVIII